MRYKNHLFIFLAVGLVGAAVLGLSQLVGNHRMPDGTAANMPEDAIHTLSPGETSNANSRQNAAQTQQLLRLLRDRIARVESSQESIQRDVQEIRDQDYAAVENDGLDIAMAPDDEYAPAADTTVEEEYQRAQAHIETQSSVLLARLEEEYPDYDWLERAETQIHDTMMDLEMDGTVIHSAECRSSLCKVEMEFDDPQSLEDGFPKLSFVIPWDGESFYYQDGSDPRRAVIYMAREGESLPLVDAEL